MKNLFILLVVMFQITLFSGIAEAAWYIVRGRNVVAVTDYEPDLSDMASRNEVAVWSDEGIPLERAAFSKNKIVLKVKSAEEMSQEITAQEIINEETLVKNEMRKLTIEKLKEQGHKFKHIK